MGKRVNKEYKENGTNGRKKDAKKRHIGTPHRKQIVEKHEERDQHECSMEINDGSKELFPCRSLKKIFHPGIDLYFHSV